MERQLEAGDPAGAVRAVFPRVMVDVQRAYGLKFPPHWTSRDILAHGLRPDMGRLADLLLRLYTLYEPARFGEERDALDGELRSIVVGVYAETSLRALASKYLRGTSETYSVRPDPGSGDPVRGRGKGA